MFTQCLLVWHILWNIQVLIQPKKKRKKYYEWRICNRSSAHSNTIIQIKQILHEYNWFTKPNNKAMFAILMGVEITIHVNLFSCKYGVCLYVSFNWRLQVWWTSFLLNKIRNQSCTHTHTHNMGQIETNIQVGKNTLFTHTKRHYTSYKLLKRYAMKIVQGLSFT